MFRFPPLTPLVRKLLITLVALFVLRAILENFLGIGVLGLLAFDPHQLTYLTPVQAFTHILVVPPVPGMVLSLLISLAFLWLILAPFEARYGQRRMVELILVSAVSAAVPAWLVAQVLPSGILSGPQTITLSVMCAYAVLLPAHAEVSFFGLFPMQPKHLIMIVIGFSLLNFLTTSNAAALAADLGAIGGGVAFVKWWMQKPPQRRRPRPASRPKLRVVRDGDDEPKRWLN